MLEQRDEIMMRSHHDLVFLSRSSECVFAFVESETFIYFCVLSRSRDFSVMTFGCRAHSFAAQQVVRKTNILLGASIPACARNYSSQTGVRHEREARRGKTKDFLCAL
jgi:hypothetical protein